eukprot:jgi/Mesvir1/22125/Mv18728-RA.1
MSRVIIKTAKDFRLVSNEKDGKFVSRAIASALRTHYQESEPLDDDLLTFFYRLVAVAIETGSVVAPFESAVEEIEKMISNPSLPVRRAEFPPAGVCMDSEWLKSADHIAHTVATGVSFSEFRKIQTELREGEEVSLAYNHFTRLCVDIVRSVVYAGLTGGQDDSAKGAEIMAYWYSLLQWSGAHRIALEVCPRGTIVRTMERLSSDRKVYMDRRAYSVSRSLLPELVTDDESSEASTEF